MGEEREREKKWENEKRNAIVQVGGEKLKREILFLHFWQAYL